jgi:hypothetical protein
VLDNIEVEVRESGVGSWIINFILSPFHISTTSSSFVSFLLLEEMLCCLLKAAGRWEIARFPDPLRRTMWYYISCESPLWVWFDLISFPFEKKKVRTDFVHTLTYFFSWLNEYDITSTFYICCLSYSKQKWICLNWETIYVCEVVSKHEVGE